MRKKYLLLTLSVLIISMGLMGCNSIKANTKSTAIEHQDTTESKLDKLVSSYAKQGNFSGNILICKENKVLLEKSYGMADYKDKIPNTPQTIFRLGSITKQFTAMAVMMLEEKGQLNTEDTLSKYIPDYPSGNKIKLHNLLNHSSGIPEHATVVNMLKAANYNSPTDIISLFKNTPLSFEPGTKFQYCNSNYILLGYIIEKVSGMKYEDFIKENIFKPLDMKNSGYDHNEAFKEKAIGYSKTTPSGYEVEAPYIDMSFPYSAGALYSTVDDLQKWDQALYGEKLVKKSTLDKIFTPYINSNIPNYGYGYGWYINKTSSSLKMTHSGEVNGFLSLIYRDVNKKIFVVTLSNCQSQRALFPMDEILKLLD